MESDNLIDYRIYEDEELKVENAIFKAYLHAFFRHKAYICKLYNSGKICESQAVDRISVAWEKLKLIRSNRESQINLDKDDAKSRFYLIQPILFYLYLEAEVGLWN
ncbi:hypothetical protein NIES2100_62080 [Calothrix sp. NIES-2100]|uniref:DUF7219 family protein n=1 Tax=Calothrix sp. NIES-2100 TaxID=1954172 RepID=UPI000B5F13A7|nr:hypothetical protein NIES2100_62080 [Calothrix sp. NIES-2100]